MEEQQKVFLGGAQSAGIGCRVIFEGFGLRLGRG